MGDGFVLMRLATLQGVPEASLDGLLHVPSALSESKPQQPRLVLGWSSSIERSRADFVRIHRDVGDEMGQDPDVFDSTFGCDADRLAKRMAFLYSRAGDAAGQVQPESELLVAVGTCTAWEINGVGWIHSLAVSTDYQGRGLSKILLGAALHRLRDVRWCCLRPSRLDSDLSLSPVRSSATLQQCWPCARPPIALSLSISSGALWCVLALVLFEAGWTIDTAWL